MFLAVGASILILVFAFVAAPRSCEWGLDAYFWAGAIAVALFALMPLLARGRPGADIRPRSFLPLAGVLVAWLGGFLLAGFRLMCRLF